MMIDTLKAANNSYFRCGQDGCNLLFTYQFNFENFEKGQLPGFPSHGCGPGYHERRKLY